jgi:cis-3-alkyl-4-acyloxetan-2-one decarboxylase
MNPAVFTPQQFIVTGRNAVIDGANLFWQTSGEGLTRSTVLFLHGIPSWCWMWRNVVPQTGILARSIAVDLPGFGMSDPRPDGSFRVPDLARSIKRFIDYEIGNDSQVSLVVHDLGALVGAELIAREPDRYEHVVFMNTSLRHEAWSGEGPLRILSIPVAGQVSMYLAQPWMLRLAMAPFVSNPAGRTGIAFDGYWYPFQYGFGQNLARLFQQRIVEVPDFERWRRALQRYRGRSLVLWGGRDPTFTLDEFQDLVSLLSSPESMVYQSASHFLPEDQPYAVSRRIRSFLAGVTV